MTYVTLVAAMVLSAITAYFSVLGLSTIFAASATEVMIMAAALETVKVITAIWIHNHWSNIGGWIRAYLVVAVIVLGGITSMGVFGLLSKGFLEHRATIEATIGQELKIVNADIAAKQSAIDEIEKSLSLKNSSLETIVKESKTRKQAERALSRLSTESKVKESSTLEALRREMLELNKNKIALESKYAVLKGEIGPLMYLAKHVYGDSSNDAVDKAALWLIVALVLTLDPLALMLLMASSSELKRQKAVVKSEPVAETVKEETPDWEKVVAEEFTTTPHPQIVIPVKEFKKLKRRRTVRTGRLGVG